MIRPSKLEFSCDRSAPICVNNVVRVLATCYIAVTAVTACSTGHHANRDSNVDADRQVDDESRRAVFSACAPCDCDGCEQLQGGHHLRGLLDDVVGANAAFDFGGLRTEVPDAVLRVRRSSDQATQDIGVVYGQLDKPAFEHFAGSDTVYVERLYDQSGNGHDALQPIADRQPVIRRGPNGRNVFSVDGTQGFEIPGASAAIDNADELTVFFVARWQGMASGPGDIIAFNAGLHIPAGGEWPFALFLSRTAYANIAGTPNAQFKLSDRSRVTLRAQGTFGRAGVYEIHEFVFDKDRRAALYNSGRLVDERVLRGRRLLSRPAHTAGVSFGANGTYNDGFVGQMSAPLIFPRALSDAERSLVRRSLSAHYGVPLPENRPPSGDEFTIVVIPDTQWYAAGRNGVQRQTMDSAFSWIASNRDAWNIQLLTHLGDIVDRAHFPYQWAVVDDWFRSLDSVGLPYALSLGNHDYAEEVADRDSRAFNATFPSHRFTEAGWWNGGLYEEDKSDNLWFVRTVAGEDYIVLTLEFQPRSGVIAWANAVLTAHSDKKAIIITHDFMNQQGTFDISTDVPGDFSSGSELYANLVRSHDNVFLVLNGHHARGTSRRFDRATGAHFLFFDPMLLDWGGGGWIRLLVVSPSRGTTRVMTYSPHLRQFRSDYQNLFTLP